jgi:tRNA wybutosine-synthesizing protein 4
VSNEEKSRIEKLELFDEYEAWHLKCTHYILLSATKGEFCETVTQASYDKSGVDVTNMMASLNLSGGLAAIIKPSIVTMEPCEVKFGLRFGHRMSLIGSNLFVFGGFGELASDVLGKHLRISAIEVFNLAANQLSVIELPGGAIGDRIFHDCVTLGKDTIYLTFGRSNPSKLFDSIIKIKVTANEKGCVVDSSQIVAEQVAIVNQAELGVLPRFRHATCATVDDKLFLHGGKFYDESASSNLILNDAYVLDDTNKLVKVNVCIMLIVWFCLCV